MRELFDKRRHSFTNQVLKYLRYVFNDHFVLALMFLLGFVASYDFGDSRSFRFWKHCDLLGEC